MTKHSSKWLKDFKSVYKPSKSFFMSMNNALQNEYCLITKRDFDVLYLFFERPSDLVYLSSEHAAVLKASVEVYKPTYWGNCLIGWRHKLKDRLVKPEDEIEDGTVAFKWIELSLPIFPEDSSIKLDLVKRLGLTLNYRLIAKDGYETTDLELYVQLTDSLLIETLANRLYNLRANWNEQADQDITRRKGYIHWLSYEREEEGRHVFRMDIGSAGEGGFKLILNELNNPVWQVQIVEIFYL